MALAHAGFGLAISFPRRCFSQGYAPSPMGIISVDSRLLFAIQYFCQKHNNKSRIYLAISLSLPQTATRTNIHRCENGRPCCSIGVIQIMSGQSLRQECHSRQLQHGQILVSVCFTLMPFAASYSLNYSFQHGEEAGTTILVDSVCFISMLYFTNPTNRRASHEGAGLCRKS